MTKFREVFRQSRLVKDVITRVLVLHLISIIVISCLSTAVIQPILRRQSIQIASETSLHMSNVLNSACESISTIAQYTMSSAQLHDVLLSDRQAHTDQTFHDVRLTLNQLASNNAYIRGIILEGPDSARFTSIIGVEQQDLLMLENAWYVKLAQSDYGQGFTMYYDQDDAPVIFFTYTGYIASEKYTLTILYNASPVLESVQQYAGSMFSGFVIHDLDNNVLYQSGDIPLSDDLFTGEIQSIQDDRDGVYFINAISSGMWSIVSFAGNQSISLTYRSYLLAMVALYCVSGILILLLHAPYIYRRIKPISALSHAMAEITPDNLTHVPELEIDDEIGDLSKMINRMIDNLIMHVDNAIAQEKQQQKMQYSLLISQIDPHFIYNTMSIINCLAAEHRVDDIIEINTALIEILQDRLRVNAIEVLDTVRHEIGIVENYLRIQNHRYENYSTIHWDVDEDVLDLKIPKNVIQPLVENALFHGLIDEDTGDISGDIYIRVFTERDIFFIQVEDTGRGIAPPRLAEIRSGLDQNSGDRGRHIGLRNIFQRLKYLYQEDCALEIVSERGVTITMKIELDRLLDGGGPP